MSGMRSGLTGMGLSGSDFYTMPSLRAAIASLVVPGIVLLNCACLCSPSAAAQFRRLPVSATHPHCRGSDDSAPSHHQRSVPHDSSSGQCPHCDHAQVSAATADNGTGLLVAPQLLTGVLALRIVTPERASATLRRPIAVIHSPPALALLRQKCVLLI
jgi:hypothetical protein